MASKANRQSYQLEEVMRIFSLFDIYWSAVNRASIDETLLMLLRERAYRAV